MSDTVTVTVHHGDNTTEITYTRSELERLIASLRREDYADPAFYVAQFQTWSDLLARCTAKEQLHDD